MIAQDHSHCSTVDSARPQCRRSNILSSLFTKVYPITFYDLALVMKRTAILNSIITKLCLDIDL